MKPWIYHLTQYKRRYLTNIWSSIEDLPQTIFRLRILYIYNDIRQIWDILMYMINKEPQYGVPQKSSELKSVVTKYLIHYDLVTLYGDILKTLDISRSSKTRLYTQKNSYNEKLRPYLAFTSDTPYLALKGELWSVFREISNEIWPR